MNLRSIDADALLFLHQENLGSSDPENLKCDRSLLNAALAYPVVLAENDVVDVAALAAAYAFGMLKYRPFAKNNHSAAFLAMGLFLYLNDWRLSATQDDAIGFMQRMATGDEDEASLANWVRANL